jgi:hypothetical protein
LTLERHGDFWKLSEPQKHTIRQRWKIDDLLDELSRLEYAAVVAESAANSTQYGLDTPQVQVTLWPANGTPIGPFAIGKATDARSSEPRSVFAQVGPHTPLYIIQADFLEVLPKTVADLTSE